MIVFEQDLMLTKRMLSEVFALLASGAVQPVQPLNAFSIAKVEDALRLIQAGKHAGKVILQANQDTEVKVCDTAPATHDAAANLELQAFLRPSVPTKFVDDESYILIGGLGGLDRALCRWPVSQGCKNIIVLSRSDRSLPRLQVPRRN